MFTLVKFCNGDYYVTLSNKVQRLENSDCIVKYKGRGNYQAAFIKAGDNRNELDEFQKQGEVASVNNALPSSQTRETISSDTSSSDGKSFEQCVLSNSQDDISLYQVVADSTTTEADLFVEGNSTPNILEGTFILQGVSSPLTTSELPPLKSQFSKYDVSYEKHLSVNLERSHLIDAEMTYTLNSDQGLQSTSKGEENEPSINQEGRSHNYDESLDDCTASDGDGGNDVDYVPDDVSYNNSGSIVSGRKTASLPNTVPFDSQTLTVPKSNSGTQKNMKKYFCPYCLKLQTKFARHIEKVHNTEPDVQKFVKLPKGNLERGKIIETIRKKGNYLHNTTPELNSGILITCRQPQERYHKIPEDYIPCSSCKGFFSRKTLRLHFTKCNPNHKKGARNITVMGRRMISYMHNRANEILRQFIFPVMREDEVTRSVRYDELLIIFGNKLCEKYSHAHQYDMIRAHLRLLGRFKLAIKKINEDVDDFASIFHPKFFDFVIMAVRECARYDLNTRTFGAPAVATTLGTLLKKCLRHHMAECIKKQEDEKKKSAENFLILFDDDFPTVINKKVLEDQANKKREKRVILPSRNDIKLLYDYLKKNCDRSVENLKKRFHQTYWKDLCENTLILVQMFNRRRAGEIKRLLITDFENQETIDKSANPDMFKQLSQESRECAKKYTRLTLRGKLGRTVPVLLDNNLVEYINIILKHRIFAGVKSDNEFIFAVPCTNNLKKNYLRACILMRKFSRECGASIPTSLRGTTLRKHIATYTAMIGIEENQVSDLANFMGHNKQIHKDIYRMSSAYKDVTGVSRILHDAIFSKEDEGSSDEESSGDDGEDVIVEKTVAPRKIRDDYSEGHSSFPNTSLNSSKRRSTSPFGKTRRVKWSDAERAAVREAFGIPSEIKKLPSLNACQDAIKKYKVLGRRQPQHLKSWIDNQRKAKSRARLNNS